MEPRTLTVSEIRTAVAAYCGPNCLAAFDKLRAKPLFCDGMSLPIDWNNSMRLGLLLDLWAGYDPRRPN